MMQHSAFSLTLAQSCPTRLTALPFTRSQSRVDGMRLLRSVTP
uniref:Uncharacterized protein n=1 Tax=Arundo donax TaxID=35708 RepID=A0A0A9DKC0_ARUDO